MRKTYQRPMLVEVLMKKRVLLCVSDVKTLQWSTTEGDGVDTEDVLL